MRAEFGKSFLLTGHGAKKCRVPGPKGMTQNINLEKRIIKAKSKGLSEDGRYSFLLDFAY